MIGPAVDEVATVLFFGGSLNGTTRQAAGGFARRFVVPTVFDGMRAVETYKRETTSWDERGCTIEMHLEQLQVTEVAP